MPELTSQTLRVALYGRVSTEEQREGQTIDSQIAELDRFAREKGWQITGVYKDDGWSGTILARPELDRLRDDGSKGIFNAALFNDVDRLARDVSHLGIVKRDLQRHGVQMIFRKLPAEQSPTHNLMVNILGSFAEFERELILDRTRRGSRHKVEVRKQFLGGLAPYGFRYVPKDKSANKEGYLEIVPDEATIVRQMFEWVDKEGLSARKIVQRLSSMNAVPRKKGKRWGKSSVLRILRSETYAGVWHYNKHEGCEPIRRARVTKYRKSLKSSGRLRPQSEWLPLILPETLRLIDRDQWRRVQEQLSRNITFSPRNSKHQYLLKGLVKCGGCGARYVGDPCHGTYYYRCHARCKKVPTIKQEHFDGTVWSAIEEAVLNPELIADHVDDLTAKQTVVTEQLRTEESEIEKARSELRIEEARILEAYRKGIITPEQLGVELEQINARKSALETRASHITRNVVATPAPISKRSLHDWCQSAAKGLKRFTDQDRQQFLRLLVNDIIFEGERIRIRGVIPVPTSKEDSHPVGATLQQQNGCDAQSPTAGIAEHQRDRYSVVSDDGIVAPAGYSHAPNTVGDVTFELIRSVPQKPLTLRQQLDDFFIRSLVQRYPGFTLQELCERVKEERGVTLRRASMDKLMLRLGLTHKVRQQLCAGRDRTLNLAA
jgi:site-specific DNA recombinase